MAGRVEVALLPALLNRERIAEKTAVVIDILRASTTMVTALAHGAQAVWPCLEIDEALNLRNQLRGAVTGGERGGVPIDGFDYSNSPADYSREHVGGRPVVFTTTNGTRALASVRDAQRCWIGAFVNLSGLIDRLRGDAEVILLCAGTNGAVTREDVLFAGAVVERLVESHGWTLSNDEAQLALATWQQAQRPAPCRAGGDTLADQLAQTQGGRNLIALGYEADLERVAQVDAYAVTPRWDAERSCLVVP